MIGILKDERAPLHTWVTLAVSIVLCLLTKRKITSVSLSIASLLQAK